MPLQMLYTPEHVHALPFICAPGEAFHLSVPR